MLPDKSGNPDSRLDPTTYSSGPAEALPQIEGPAALRCLHCGQAYRADERVCLICGIGFRDKLKTKSRVAPQIPLPTCANCGKAHQPNTLVCSGCGVSFDPHGAEVTKDTKDRLPGLTEVGHARKGQGQEAPFTNTTIIFDNGHRQLILPVAAVVEVGRLGGTEDAQSTLDLSPFGALEKSVSRRHLSIRRWKSLIYVADLGSTNGTWLNGQRLFPNGERLLCSNDELRLSHLTLRVQYHPGKI